MAGSAHIIIRVRTSTGWKIAAEGREGERRYVVRYRLGGRESRLRHGGSFRTRKEADARRRFLLEEMAAGRIPDLNPAVTAAKAPTVASLVQPYITSRRDVTQKVRNDFTSRAAHLPDWLLALTVAEVDLAAVRQMVDELEEDDDFGPATVARVLSLLRAVLDYAGVDPNPAADRRIKLTPYEQPEIQPPSTADLLALLAALSEKWARVVCVIEGSGMRPVEAAKLLGRDVDRARGRLRVLGRRSKRNSAGERYIPVGPDVMGLIPEADSDRRVLGFEPGSLRTALITAAENGAPKVTMRAVRHRRAARLVAQGLPITAIREQLGHSHASMTLDVYAHVLLDPADDPAVDLASLWHS